MCWMHDFRPSTSIPSIFYEKNLIHTHLISIFAITVAQNYLKISVNQFFGNFKLPLWIFQNKLNSDFWLTYTILWSTKEPEKMKNLSELKVK